MRDGTPEVRKKLATELQRGSGKLFGKFAVRSSSLQVDYVADQCKQMVCSHQCQYYFYQLKFVCLCPDPRNPSSLVRQHFCVSIS